MTPVASPPERAADPRRQIQSRLNQARRVWRFSEFAARALVWCAAVFATAVFLAVFDNIFHLPGPFRMGLGIAFVAGAAAGLFAWVLRPLAWRLSDPAVAVYLERKLGERENALINAVQLRDSLHASKDAAISTSMIEQIVAQAATRASAMSFEKLWEKKRLRRGAAILGGVIAGLLAYALILPAHAQNALRRYVRPLSGVPPMSDVRLRTFPEGEIEIVSGNKLTVHCVAFNAKEGRPTEAVLVAETADGVQRIPMVPAGAPPAELADAFEPSRSATFIYEFPNLRQSFSFTVLSGDGQSEPCRVSIRERPTVTAATATIEPPAYTGLKASQEPADGGSIRALAGSRVTLAITPSAPLTSATLTTPEETLMLQGSESGTWTGSFTITREGGLFVVLNGVNGAENPNGLEGIVTIQTDGLPTVAFENSSLNIPVLPGAEVPLAVRSADDIGLRAVRLILARNDDAESGQASTSKTPTLLKEWTFAPPGRKTDNAILPLTIDPTRFKPGETYTVFAEAEDHCPLGKRIARSAPLLLRVLAAGQMGVEKDSPRASVFQRIQELIDLQTKARGRTVSLKEFLDEVFEQPGLSQKRFEALRESQHGVRGAAQKLAMELAKPKEATAKEITKSIAVDLLGIVDGSMREASTVLVFDDGAYKDKTRLGSILAAEEPIQTDIIHRLTALLGSIAALDREKKNPPDTAMKDDQESQRLRDALGDMKEDVQKFIEAQKKIIKTTEELDKKKPEDLSDEDKKTLGDLAKEEEDWAKYFKEKAQDMSKVPTQDFSSSALSKEFNEVFQEIQKASEALNAKNTEIAVRNEEAGLELAKSIQTNLEKWLPDSRDKERWTMEEPKGEFDVPLADLPKELEDIIGELVDDEEKMTEDVQDASSSFLDSMDKGVGWDAMDGNISSMSAKGVTGNRLPNQQEVSGRSGEGRSGKSQGQFVEETADGKGGQQTPARTTPDPYENGQVADKSKDELGGSTGGGKNSGNAGLGMRGEPPPQTKQKLERMRGFQAQLRQKAEKITTTLNAYHLPSSDMEEAVRRMREVENAIQTGKGVSLKQAHSSAIDSMKSAKKALNYKAEINREKSRDLPKHVQQQILSGMQTKAPKGYQDLMDAYYKSLVEPNE